MKIYIAGKITGDPYYKAKFARAAADIADAGHTPINPAMQPEGMSNADYMRVSFAQLDSADAVAFLPDWEDSKGARIEHLLVEYTGKPTYDIKSARLVLPESKEHSRKTRQDVFLEQCPEAGLDTHGLMQLCPMAISAAHRDGRGLCADPYRECGDCRREFWMQEVE